MRPEPLGPPASAAAARCGPLTVAQEQLWRLDATLPEPAALNLFYALAADGPVDPAALRAAVAELCRRHEPLRTTYGSTGAGEPLARVHPPEAVAVAAVGEAGAEQPPAGRRPGGAAPDPGRRPDDASLDPGRRPDGAALEPASLRQVGFAWAVADLAGLRAAGASAEEAAARVAWHEARRPFDLARGPLLRVVLLPLAPGRQVLLVHLHHICADGWSLDLLARELSQLYAAALGRRPCRLAAPGPCTGHAARHRLWLGGEEAGRQRAWWRAYLRGVPGESFRLPGAVPAGPRPRGAAAEGMPRPAAGADLPREEDPPRPAAAPDPPLPTGLTRLMRQTRTLAPQLVAGLRQAGREREASWFMLWLAGLDIALARWTGCTDVVVGTLAANRPTAAAAEMLGAHYNAVLLSCSLAGDPSLGEVLQRVVESALPALDHQELPLAVVAGDLAAALGIEPAAIPAVMLQADRQPLAALRLQGATVTALHLDDSDTLPPADLAAPRAVLAAACAPLTLFVREAEGGVTLSLFYDPAVIGHAAAAFLLDAHLAAVGALTGPLDLPALASLELEPPPVPAVPCAGAPPDGAGRDHGGPARAATGATVAAGRSSAAGPSATGAARPRLLPCTSGSPAAAVSPVAAWGLGLLGDLAVPAPAAGSPPPAAAASPRPPGRP